jgi:YVTN family beta-propeller protein
MKSTRESRPLAAPNFLLPFLGEGGPKDRMRERDRVDSGRISRTRIVRSLHAFLLSGVLAPFSIAASAAQLLVLNKTDASLAFIDPATGKTNATVATGEGPHEIELSADGKVAFISNYESQAPNGMLTVIDIPARKQLEHIDLGEMKRPHGLSLAAGHLYFTSEASRRIGRVDPKSRQVDWQFETGQNITHMVLATRDGSKLFATNIGSNNVSVIERGKDGQWQQTLITVGAGPEGFDLSPKGNELWVAHSRDGGISIINVATKKVVKTIAAQTKRSNRLKFTRDGALVLISDLSGGELVVIDAATRSQKKRLPLGRQPTGILVAPDGKHAYIACSGDNVVVVVDLKSLKIAKKIETGATPDGMAWVK